MADHVNMAERPIVLNNVLCYLFSRLKKCKPKALKAALISFFGVDTIGPAKDILMENVSTLQLTTPYIPNRRDSEGRAGREMDDIFTIINVVDEAKMLDKLPIFVSDGPENMPTVNLVEGDMVAIMNRFDKIEMTMTQLQLAVNKTAAIVTTVSKQVEERGSRGQPVHQPVPASASSAQSAATKVNKSKFMNEQPVASGSTARPPPGFEKMRKQLDQMDMLNVGDWAGVDAFSSAGSTSGDVDEWRVVPARKKRHFSDRKSVESSPSAADNLFRLPAPRQACPRNDNQSTPNEPNTQSINREQHDRQPKVTIRQHNKSAPGGNIDSNKYAAAAAKPKLKDGQSKNTKSTKISTVKLIGTKQLSLSPSPAFLSKVSAARPYVSKAVFCVDNVSTECSAADLMLYVASLGVDALSCAAIKPRRSRWQRLHDITPTDRLAFRLCVPREQSDKLLDASRWPAHVTITDYFFSKNKRPTTTPSTRPRRPSDDHDEHRLDSATSEPHSLSREKPLEASRPRASSASSSINDPVEAAVAASGGGTTAEDTSYSSDKVTVIEDQTMTEESNNGGDD